jgi:hypothetical protein
MRYLAILICGMCAVSCDDFPESPYTWHDPETGCDFPLGEPSSHHYAMWVKTYTTAQSIWPHTPCPIRVTIIETPDELIYVNGQWQEWKVGRIGFAILGSRPPEIFIAGFFPDNTIPLTMAHELVHVVWRMREHPDTFWERNEELLIAMGII